MNARTRNVLLFSALAVVGACGACSVGGLALTALDSEGEPPSTAPFRANGPGRLIHEWTVEDPSLGAPLHYGVELIHLPALDDSPDDAETALIRLWSTAVASDWVASNGGPPSRPLVLRRFLPSGARAWFATAELKPKAGGNLTLVWLLLVEGEHLEPVVVLQTYQCDAHLAVTKDEFARYSWAVSHPLVEQALATLAGTRFDLVMPEEALVGAWKHSNGSALEWVNTTTGKTTMSALSYLVRYDFTASHRFVYSYASADGVAGAQRFSGERGEGDWSLSGDVLTLTSDDGKVRRLLVLGSPTRADGSRALMLSPEPWSLQPRAIWYSGELYTPLVD